MTFEQESAAEEPDEPGLIPILTLVIWVGCVVVGLLGLLYSRSRDAAPATQPESVRAEFLQVDVVRDLPPPDVAVPPEDSPPPDAAVQPVMAVMPAAALPNPAIAFALPVKGPAVPVAARRAIPVAAAPTGQSAPPGVQRLTFGQGAGRQPAPEYPREAAIDGEQGVVLVAFTVGEDGHVLSARASVPSPWPMLNQAAVRTVRQEWRFPAGPVRNYEISIEFQLTQ